MLNPYVFIVGCPRSGTTLLKRMLNAHSQIAVTSESNWITRAFEKGIGITSEGLVRPELLPFLLEDIAFTRLNVSREELQGLIGTGEQISYSRFISSMFDSYGKARGKDLVGNKTPAHVRRLQTLHQLWPQARFIHLIRDGRDVCLSVVNWPAAHRKKPGTFSTWTEDWVTTTAFWWELHVRLGQQAGAWLGAELYYEVSYESLVKHPAEESEALCQFLGLPFDEAMLNFQEGRTRNDPNLESKQRWLPATVGLRDWRNEMASESIERFEAAVGPLLEALGYPRAFPNPSIDKLEHVLRIHSLLAQDPSWISHSDARSDFGSGHLDGMVRPTSSRA